MLDGYGPSNIYLTKRKFGDLNPVDFGWERCRPGHDYGPAIREYYLIHYVTSGSGTFKNARGEYTVSAGELFLIRPGEVTYYKASEKDPWIYSWVGFVGELATAFDDAPDIMAADCRRFFEGMKYSVEFESMREEIITGQLFLMMAELLGQKGGRTHGSGYAERAANYIECHYMQTLSVNHLANALNIDRRYLSRLFKHKYGMTVQEYVVASRMKHAAEFLGDGYSVSQSAAMTGYTDVFNFSKMFKKYHGVPPSAMKKR